MPADHINIQHPARRDIHCDMYRDRLAVKKMQVELEQLTQWHESVCRDLESIFNRIEEGEPCELHYPDGRVIVITGKERG